MKKAILLLASLLIISGCSTVDKAKTNLTKEVKSWNTIAIEKKNLKIFKTKTDKHIYYQKTDKEPKLLTEEELADYLLKTVIE